MTGDEWRPTCTVDALRLRARVLAAVRTFFASRGVLEVHTPTLAPTTVSEPAIESLRLTNGTYLQTSPEYYMKRLLAAGAPALYQIGPVYRAGERGRLHNPEFTMLEWYRPGFDDAALMDEVAALVELVLGPAPLRTLPWRALVPGAAGRPREQLAREQLDLAFADALSAFAGERVFVTDFPADQAALARRRASDPSVAARFELIVDGVEIANGYHELADPEELRARFEADNTVRRELGLAPIAPDEDLLAAMASGLPDCAGVALGLDRLVMLAAGATSLAEVMPFPDRG
jgi:lysyl-tRNA synthetase class 2